MSSILKTSPILRITTLSLALLYTSCSDSGRSELSSAVLQSNRTQKPEELLDPNLFSYVDNILRDVTLPPKVVPGIEITRLQKNGSRDPSPPDLVENLSATLVTFRELPGKAPYRVYARRLLQDDPNTFISMPFEQILLNTLHAKNLGSAYTVTLPRQGFLPGERVTWQIQSADGITTEVTICPWPMILKDKSGQIVLEAALVTIHTPFLSYLLHIPAQEELVEFISRSEDETLRNILPLGQPVAMTHLPAVKGVKGGINHIELRFLNSGSSYKMDLPWGTALTDYLKPKEK